MFSFIIQFILLFIVYRVKEQWIHIKKLYFSKNSEFHDATIASFFVVSYFVVAKSYSNQWKTSEKTGSHKFISSSNHIYKYRLPSPSASNNLKYRMQHVSAALWCQSNISIVALPLAQLLTSPSAAHTHTHTIPPCTIHVSNRIISHVQMIC